MGLAPKMGLAPEHGRPVPVPFSIQKELRFRSSLDVRSYLS